MKLKIFSVIILVLMFVGLCVFAACAGGCSAKATGGQTPSVGVAILQGVGDVAPDALLIGAVAAKTQLESAHTKGKVNEATYAIATTLIDEGVQAATDYQAAVDAGQVVDQAAVNKRVRAITRRVLVAAITGKLPAQ